MRFAYRWTPTLISRVVNVLSSDSEGEKPELQMEGRGGEMLPKSKLG